MTEAELEDLQECSEMFDFTGFIPEDDKRLLAEVRRLRAALKRYGHHEAGPDGCRYEPCTCGLDAVLKGGD